VKKQILLSSLLEFLTAAFAVSMTGISAPVDGVTIKKITASSVLEPSGKTYSVINLMDRDDNSWCEGKKDDGVGETVTVHLEKPGQIKSIYIKNGLGVKKYFSANNRVRVLEINGTDYTLRDSDAFQKIDLVRAVTTDRLELKIKSVYPGTKYRDTCIAEVSLTDISASGAYGSQDDYPKLLNKTWEADNDMPGSAVTFNADYTVSSEDVPCGDESCPSAYNGSCEKLSANKYDCRITEHCYGEMVDIKTSRVERVCKPENYAFILSVINGKPEINHGGKKVILNEGGY